MRGSWSWASVGALSIACAAGGVLAFDSEAWAARNADMTADALRMRKAYAAFVARTNTPATDVTIPFETFEDGKVKSYVFARQGQFFPLDGAVWAHGVTVKQLGHDGSVEMRLDADNCLVDLRRKCCWVEGHVRAEHRKTVLEGTGAYCNSSNDYLKVMSDAKVVSEDVKMKGLRL